MNWEEGSERRELMLAEMVYLRLSMVIFLNILHLIVGKGGLSEY